MNFFSQNKMCIEIKYKKYSKKEDLLYLIGMKKCNQKTKATLIIQLLISKSQGLHNWMAVTNSSTKMVRTINSWFKNYKKIVALALKSKCVQL